MIRPAIVQLPLLEYISLVLSHRLELEKQINEFRPDVVVSFGILNAYLASHMCKKKSIPFVYYLIDHLHTLVPQKIGQPLAKAIESTVLKRSDRIIVINKGLVDYVRLMGADPAKVVIIPGGVDLSRYRPNPEKRAEIRVKYKIDDADIVLFFMGWLYSFSGLKEVALSLANTKRSKSHLKMLIVGEGEAYFDLCKIRDIYDLADRLILVGKQPFDLILDYLSASDICLLPAYLDEVVMQNIVPIKMYEYMAASKPVIATRLPGIQKEFGESSGIVYIDHPEEVVEKAYALKGKLITQEGEKARRAIESNDWSVLVEMFEKELDNLRHSRSKASRTPIQRR